MKKTIIILLSLVQIDAYSMRSNKSDAYSMRSNKSNDNLVGLNVSTHFDPNSMRHARSVSSDSACSERSTYENEDKIEEERKFYRSLLVKMFLLSDKEATENAVFTISLNEYSNLTLNIAAQARNVNAVKEALNFVTDSRTIEEALRRMDNPYMMCAGLPYDTNNSSIVTDLLNQKLLELQSS